MQFVIAARTAAARDWCSCFASSLHSWTSFVRFIETKESSFGDDETRNKWSNADMDVSPRSDWTWGWFDYAAFWWSYGFSVGVWSVGSSMVAIGLNYYQAIICVFLSHVIGAIGVVLHSRSAARYHFGFPVEARITWGLWGSYFPIVVRVMVATVWVGVLTTQGGYFMAVFLRCVFGNSFYGISNTLPGDAGIITTDLIGVILYWVVSFPFLFMTPSQTRYLFRVKSFIMPPVVIGLFIYCMLQPGLNGKSSSPGSFRGTPGLSGGTLAWAMFAAINSCMGKTSTLMVNQPDIARYARTPSATIWSQLVFLIVGNTFCAALGIFATSAIQSAWGTLAWNPWALSQLILNHNFSAGARASIALVALGFMLSIAASNMAADLIPWGADTSAILPRFLNIRRGMVLAYCLGLCILPWKILTSATTFLRFLGGYSIFLAPLMGIFVTDYFVIRKGNVFVSDLYSASPRGRYWYTYGVSWRAAVTYVVAVVLPVPGFIGLFGVPVPEAWANIYKVGWLLGCVFSSVVHNGLCHVGEFASTEKRMRFEEIADQQVLEGTEPREAISDGASGVDVTTGKGAGISSTEKDVAV